MKCFCCAQEVTYAGIPTAHFGRVVPLQNEAAPFERHTCKDVRGGLALRQVKFIVPLYDGGLVLCIDVDVN